jgi:ABC-2 type transport system permease protein
MTASPIAMASEVSAWRGHRPATSARTFAAVLWRDVFAAGRELPSLLVQVVVQPVLTLFVFGRVLVDLGYTQAGFGAVLLPGLVALNGFMTAVQNTATPLIVELSWSGELEDRLLAPLPVPLVAVEKMVFGAVCGVVGGLVMAPLGFLVLDTPSWPPAAWPDVLLILTLGSLAGAAIGLTLGTLVPPHRISVVFAVVFAPLTFSGAVQFSWFGLARLPWFQVVCALNPLTYVSEGMRAVTMPALASIPLWVDVVAVAAAAVVFGALGTRGFTRRVLA